MNPSRTAPPQQAAEAMNSYGMRHFTKYRVILKETDRGRAAQATLAADPRIAALDRSLIWRGGGGSSFSLDHFVMWFLYLEDERGAAAAKQILEDFLTRPEHPVLATQWVVGISVEHTIPLGDGFEVRPVSAMPASTEQEHFSRVPGPFAFQEALLPQCALVKECTNRVIFGTGEQPADSLEFTAALKRLGVMPLLLNALEGISCLPRLVTGYAGDTVPYGPFSGGGGGLPSYDVIGSRVDRLSPAAAARLAPLLAHYEARPPADRHRLELILHRLCQAKRHDRLDDKVLDLGIALEMMLLDDNRQNDQLALTFRLRGSWLLGSTAAERTALYESFREIYSARSRVAHGGVLLRAGDDISRVHVELPGWLNLACRVFQRLLAQGKPDWAQLVLGA